MRTRATAFTLIEVLASTILAALLMVAVLGVSQSTARHHRVMADTDKTPMWVGQVFDRIAWDLQHARSYAVQDGRLTLAGYGSLDEKTYEPTQRPVTIEYRLMDGNLYRSQTALDAITTRSTQRELVSVGIERFDLVAPSPRKTIDEGTVSPGGRESGEDERDDEKDNRIMLRNPAPDSMALISGLKPLDAFDVLGVTIARAQGQGQDQGRRNFLRDDSACTHSRSLIVGAGP